MQHGTVPDVLTMPVADRRRRSRGMSLIEVLAAGTICLIVSAVATSFFVSQQRMLIVQSAYAASQNVTRTFTDLFGREIRMAAYDPTGNAITPASPGPTCPGVKPGITEATPSSIRFLQDLNGDGDTADANENVRYYLSGSTVMRQNGNDAALELVDDVPSGGLTFTYYNGANPPGQIVPSGTPPALGADQRACIAKVRAQVTAQLANPQFNNINPLISKLDMEVAIRNRSLTNTAY
jgi:type II secretory pathway pseudopilin PulG